MIVTLWWQFPVKRSLPVLLVYSAASPFVAYLWRHIKRLEYLCEEHGFKRFPSVTIQKWHNAHSKMSLKLQGRRFPKGHTGGGLDVTLQPLACLGLLLQNGWGAGRFLLWCSVVTMTRMCLLLWSLCDVYYQTMEGHFCHKQKKRYALVNHAIRSWNYDIMTD